MEHKCLRDYGWATCKGPVEGRASYAGTGAIIYECTHHAEESFKKHMAHREVYPDSPTAPDWFDPEAAGERWDDDF